MPTYTFTITLNPIEFAAIFVQVLYVLYVFLMANKELYRQGKLTKLHVALAIVPFLVGYPMDIAFSLALAWIFYLDVLHFKSRSFSGLTLWQRIRQALNYIGDLTFTFQSSYHYRPGETLKGLALYRHKMGAFWAMVLNPWEKDHVE